MKEKTIDVNVIKIRKFVSRNDFAFLRVIIIEYMSDIVNMLYKVIFKLNKFLQKGRME